MDSREKEKRIKIDVETKQLGLLFALEFRSAISLGPMSLLRWNCRGLGNLRSVNASKEVVEREDPNIVFLMETK